MNNDHDVPRGKVEGLPIWGADIRSLPRDAPKQLVDAYRTIEIASLEIERSVAILHVLMAQRGQVVAAINGSRLPRVMATLNSSLTRDLIVSVSGLFDDDSRSTHIRQAADVIFSDEYFEMLMCNSLRNGATRVDWVAWRSKLQFSITRIQKEKYRQHLEKMRQLRQKKSHISILNLLRRESIIEI